MRQAMTTVRLRLHVPAYRILYAMGGVEVLSVEALNEPGFAAQDLLAVTLRLSGSMLGFALSLAGEGGVSQAEQADPAPEAEEPPTL